MKACINMMMRALGNASRSFGTFWGVHRSLMDSLNTGPMISTFETFSVYSMESHWTNSEVAFKGHGQLCLNNEKVMMLSWTNILRHATHLPVAATDAGYVTRKRLHTITSSCTKSSNYFWTFYFIHFWRIQDIPLCSSGHEATFAPN